MSKVFNDNTLDTKLFAYNKELDPLTQTFKPDSEYDDTDKSQENLLIDLYNFLYENLDYHKNINYILNKNAHLLIIKSIKYKTRNKYKLTDDIVNVIGLYITNIEYSIRQYNGKNVKYDMLDIICNNYSKCHKVVEYLINKGAKITKSILTYVIKYSDCCETVKCLLNTKTISYLSDDILFSVCNVEILNLLVNSGFNINHKKRTKINYKFNYSNCHQPYVLNIPNEADLNLVEYILFSYEKDNILDILDYIIDNDQFNINDKLLNYYKIIMLRTTSDNVNIIKLLLNKNIKIPEDILLTNICCNDLVDIVKFYINDQNIDINYINNSGENILHFICENPFNENFVEYLIKNGANILQKNKFGKYPIQLANLNNNNITWLSQFYEYPLK